MSATVRRPKIGAVFKPPGEDRPARILQVSLELFAEHGFEGVSIRDITARAKLHSATIYHHYGDKQSLYNFVLRTAVERETLQHMAILNGPGSARERLTAFVLNLLQSIIRAEPSRQLLERVFREADGEVLAEMKDLRETFQACINAVVEELVPGGSRIPPAVFSGIINGIPHGMSRSYKAMGSAGAPASSPGLEELADLLTRIMIASFQVAVSDRPAAS